MDNWYAKIGSDKECIDIAITYARVTGSIWSTYSIAKPWRSGLLLCDIDKTATVRREGFQEKDYYKLEKELIWTCI